MSEFDGVMVYCEVTDRKLRAISTELLGCGRNIADEMGQELSAILIGNNISGFAEEAITYGADKVYLIDDPLLEVYNTDSCVTTIEKVISQVHPKIFLLGQNDIGRDLGPRLAFRLGTAIVSDCIALSIDPVSKQVLQTKPVYGGNAQAICTNNCDPQIVTIRAKVFSPLEMDKSRKGEVINIAADIDPRISRVYLVEKVKEEIEGIKLEDAAVVVSGGRGIGGPEGFKQLEELAKLLKGAVGASRLACDNGWISDTLQVGLTGKIVTPDLYIAVGISGSTQHMAGCSSSKVIVAINNDPEANIFKEANYGVIGDWKKIIPPFNNKIKELLSD